MMLSKQELAVVRSDLRLFYLYSIEMSQEKQPEATLESQNSYLPGAVKAIAKWVQAFCNPAATSAHNATPCSDMFVAMDGCMFVATNTLLELREIDA